MNTCSVSFTLDEGTKSQLGNNYSIGKIQVLAIIINEQNERIIFCVDQNKEDWRQNSSNNDKWIQIDDVEIDI